MTSLVSEKVSGNRYKGQSPSVEGFIPKQVAIAQTTSLRQKFIMQSNLKYLEVYRGVLIMTIFTWAVSGCFITDCPNRGKREHSEWATSRNVYKQCAACGRMLLPDNSDFDQIRPSNRFLHYMKHAVQSDHRCFGPNLCCSPTEGCLSPDSQEAQMCANEDNDPSPCRNDAPTCSSAGIDAQCVTIGLCCNPRGECQSDPSCFATTKVKSNRLNPILAKLLERLQRQNGMEQFSQNWRGDEEDYQSS